MVFLNKTEQVEALNPILNLLHWNMEIKGEDLYFYYEDIKIKCIPKFMEAKGLIFQATDQSFRMFVGQFGLSLTLTRKIAEQDTRLHITPIANENGTLLQFYCQHPTRNIDCILRISESMIEMIEGEGERAIKCKLAIREDGLESSLTVKDFSKTFLIFTHKSNTPYLPCAIHYRVEEKSNLKKPKSIIASGDVKERSLDEAAKNILSLSKADQLQNELASLMETFLPGLRNYFQNRYDHFRRVELDHDGKNTALELKLKELGFDSYITPSISKSKYLN